MDHWLVPPIPVMSRSAHDRIAHRRSDETWLAAAESDPGNRVLILSSDDCTPMTGAGSALLAVEYLSMSVAPTASVQLLLGEAGGVSYFARLPALTATDLAAELAGEVGNQLAVGADWLPLRETATELSDLDVGLLTTATALAQWHRRHTHCPRCGALTVSSQAGWARTCVADGSEHFPRTDPAVIVLVHDGHGRCILARAPSWPVGRFSVLAGFVEAGESAEAAVAREIGEEVGISVKNVRYVASQPHPFPASLMLGYIAELDGEDTLRLDEAEIADAGWFSRAEVRAASQHWGQDHRTGQDARRLVALPSTVSIARQLINIWMAEDFTD
jgi:NAD+ diphosphatase